MKCRSGALFTERLASLSDSCGAYEGPVDGRSLKLFSGVSGPVLRERQSDGPRPRRVHR